MNNHLNTYIVHVKTYAAICLYGARYIVYSLARNTQNFPTVAVVRKVKQESGSSNMPLGKDFSFDIRVNRVTLREYESKGVVYVENEELLDPLWHLKHLEEVSNSKNNLLAAPNCKVLTNLTGLVFSWQFRIKHGISFYWLFMIFFKLVFTLHLIKFTLKSNLNNGIFYRELIFLYKKYVVPFIRAIQRGINIIF